MEKDLQTVEKDSPKSVLEESNRNPSLEEAIPAVKLQSKKTRTSKSSSKRRKHNAAHSISRKTRLYIVICLALLIVIAAIAIALYKAVTKYSCNLFGESYARNVEDLNRLQSCNSLRVLHFVGKEWKDLVVLRDTFQYVETVTLSIDDGLASLETITLQEGAFSHVSTLEIDSLASLKSLHLEGGNLMDISLLHLHLPSLQTLLVGDSSLTKASIVLETPRLTTICIGSHVAQESAVWSIDAEQLTSIEVGTASFTALSSVSLNQTSLQTLVIGSDSFTKAVLSIQSATQLTSVGIGDRVGENGSLELRQLPALRSLSIGRNCFGANDELVLEDFSNLSVFNITAPSFENVKKMSLSNLKLSALSFPADQFRALQRLTITSLPLLNRLVFDGASLPQGTELDLSQLPSLRSVLFAQGACSHLQRMNLVEFPSLEEVRVEGNALSAMKSLEIRSLPKLKAFTMIASNSSLIQISIQNAPVMEQFTIDDAIPEDSAFIVRNLFSLESLEVHGSTSPAFERLVVSNCFVRVLTLGNTTDTDLFSNVIQTKFLNLWNLQTLSVAGHSLGKVRSFVLAQSPLKVVTIGPESLLKVETLSLGDTRFLRSFEVGEAAMQRLNSFELDDCSQLQSVVIGDNALPQSLRFILKNASSLHSLSIGSGAFSQGEQFVIDPPEQLIDFTIGDGVMQQARELDLQKATMLKIFSVGDQSFTRVRSLLLDTDQLTSFTAGHDCFVQASMPSLRDNVFLTIFSLGNNSFSLTTGPLEFEDFYRLTTIFIGRRALAFASSLRVEGRVRLNSACRLSTTRIDLIDG